MNRQPALAFFIVLPALLMFAATAAAQVTVSPDTVNLGTGRIGSPRFNSFSVTYSGSDSLIVSQVIFPDHNGYRLLEPEIPFRLAAGEFADVRFAFLPRDTGCAEEGATVVTDAGSYTVMLTQCATAQPLHPEIDTLYTLSFPAVFVNSCSRNNLAVQPPPVAVVTLYGIHPEDPEENIFKTLADIPFQGLEFPESRSPLLPFEFCPKSNGTAYKSRFRCVTDQGIFLVETEGTALMEKIDVPHRYYLDTTFGNVGETISLTLRVDPPLTQEDRIDSIGLRLKYDRKALVPDTVVHPEFPGNGTVLLNITAEESGETGVAMQRVNGFLTGENLMTLKFIGLSTGQPENLVELDGATRSAADTLFSNGLIYLEGCTLGASGFGRRVAVESLSVDPYASAVILRYTSPNGARGTVCVIDASGAEAFRLELEPGTGAPQEFRLPLEGFFPGLYGLLIEAADDRLILPFISPR